MGPTYGPDMTTSQSWWARIGGSTSRRCKVVFGVLILFFVSSVFILQPDWHVSSAGLRLPSLHRQPASGPTASTPTVNNAPPPRKSAGTGESITRTAVLSPDEDDVLLSAATPFFTSPSGRHALVLQDDGDLVFQRVDEDGTAHPLWWTGTGDKNRDGRVLVVEKQKGHFRIALNAMVKNVWTTLWHSDLDRACTTKKRGIVERGDAGNQPQSTGMLGTAPGQLELSDQGRLSIAGLCDLYVSPKERDKERSLAVIVAGPYRTLVHTCKSHMDNLVAGHVSFSRIDVFAYVLFEAADVKLFGRSKESIEAELRKCYGTHLRSVDVLPASQVEEEYPAGKEAMAATLCGKKLRRLNNQLKTLALAADRWWAWTIANGFTHDTILRIRPDTSFKAKPAFKSQDELGQNTLVLPHPKGEHYFYCARMSGRVGVGPTDQVAYGSPTAMSHWLYMYDRFRPMIDAAGSASGPALRDISGCQVMPPGPLASDCPKPAPCSSECLSAWFLDARGVDFHVEWGWDHNVLRRIDEGPLGAEEERQADNEGDELEIDDGLVGWG